MTHLITPDRDTRARLTWIDECGSTRRTNAMLRDLGLTCVRDHREDGYYWVHITSLSPGDYGHRNGDQECVALWSSELRAWQRHGSDVFIDGDDCVDGPQQGPSSMTCDRP